ncbi:MAG: NAD(P)-binding protein, partial [Candidatus Bathyarchaeota archaeon]
MQDYDVAVVGGGIAGSVAARFSARHGFKTLLLE